jgi:hypothetical protein
MESQRRYERVEFYCRVSMTGLPEQFTFTAQSMDISLQGLGVSALSGLEKGHLVKVTFYLKDERQREVTEHIMGRIAYLRADENGSCMGISFLEKITEATHPYLSRQLESRSTSSGALALSARGNASHGY